MTADKVKEHIYDKTAKLSQYFINFIKNEGVPNDLLPLFQDNYGYRCDWNIIGGEEAREHFEPYCKPINKKYFLNLEQRKEIQYWLCRISRKLFLPEIMLKNSVKTDQVQLRIAVSMIDKLNIPKTYKDYIFDNLIYCYWIRKRAYDSFFYKEIIQFPFAPNYHLK